MRAGAAGTPDLPGRRSGRRAVARGGMRLVGLNHAHGRGECAATAIGTVRRPLRPGYSRAQLCRRRRGRGRRTMGRLSAGTLPRSPGPDGPYHACPWRHPRPGNSFRPGRPQRWRRCSRLPPRVLAGVALRSLDVLDRTVSLPQFRVLAVLADVGRSVGAGSGRARAGRINHDPARTPGRPARGFQASVIATVAIDKYCRY